MGLVGLAAYVAFVVSLLAAGLAALLRGVPQARGLLLVVAAFAVRKTLVTAPGTAAVSGPPVGAAAQFVPNVPVTVAHAPSARAPVQNARAGAAAALA